MPSLALALGAVLLAAAPALARTDLTGCTYYDSVVAPSHQAPYATRIWYVPDTGELCDFLDCGGGRAPPKTTVPGCPLYDGTATYSPSFIDPKTLGRAGAPATATTTTAAAARTASAATTTEGRTTAAPSVAGTASGSGAESTTGGASAATEPAESSGSSRSGASPASPSSSTAGRDRAATTTGTSTTPTGAAAGLPTAAAAVLGPCLLAGVAAGMGLL